MTDVEEKAQLSEAMLRQQDEQDRMVGDALANRRFMERALKAVLANDKAEIRKIRQEHEREQQRVTNGVPDQC